MVWFFSLVAHGAELPFIFNTLNQTETPSSALTLARIMQDYWISFVTNLDPNDDHGFKRTSLAYM